MENWTYHGIVGTICEGPDAAPIFSEHRARRGVNLNWDRDSQVRQRGILAAAAPDLLAALKSTLENYVNLASSGDCGNWNPEQDDFVIAARAAISEAETGRASHA